MKTQSHNLHEVSRRPISLKHLARAAALVALSVLAAPTALHAQSLSFAGAQTTIASGFGAPVGLTVDGAGNIFVAVSGDDRVVKISPAGVQTTVPASGLNSPNGVAVDAAGDVFIADRSNNRVVEVAPGGVETTVPAGGLSLPEGVALDGSGNLFLWQSDHCAGQPAPTHQLDIGWIGKSLHR